MPGIRRRRSGGGFTYVGPGFERAWCTRARGEGGGATTRIREADERVSDWELRDLWDEAQFELGKVVSSGTSCWRRSSRERTRRNGSESGVSTRARSCRGEAERYRGWLEKWRHAEKPLAPFHWEIEFPEVFDREKPGFDAIVGNPPFAGKNTISRANVQGYPDWLKPVTRRATATPTLSPIFFAGRSTSSRQGGLRPNRHEHDRRRETRDDRASLDLQAWGEIFAATTRSQVAGLAAVVVSVVHVVKGDWPGRSVLDDREVTSSPPSSFIAAATTIRRDLGLTRARAFRAASSRHGLHLR